jgi:hypothetical protein
VSRCFIACLLTLCVLGCTKPKADVSGTFTSESPSAVLQLADKKFTLKMGADTVEGESSQLLSGSLSLHPKTLNGMTEDQATAKAFKDAQEMGAPADLEIQGTVFRPITLTVSEDGKTLTVEDQPPLKGGKQPFYNALSTLTRS